MDVHAEDVRLGLSVFGDPFRVLLTEALGVEGALRHGGAPRFVPLRVRREDVGAVFHRGERRVLRSLFNQGLIELDEEEEATLSSSTVVGTGTTSPIARSGARTRPFSSNPPAGGRP